MFCPNCGNKLRDNAVFCNNCGSPVGSISENQPANNQALVLENQSVNNQVPEQTPVSENQPTNNQIPEQAPAQAQPVHAGANQAEATLSQVRSAATGAVQAPLSALTEQIASSEPGEAVIGAFGGVSGAVSDITEILNPFKTVLSGIKSLWQGFIGLFKNKQWIKIIIAGAIATVWIVLMILSYKGINISILNWLTFAHGGTGRLGPGWIGGLLGKATVAAMIFSLISGGFKHFGSGFKSLFQGSNFNTNNLGVLLLGAGGALILYQFFAGNAVWTDTMPAISGAIIPIMSLGRGDGFLYRIAQSITAKKTGMSRTADNQKIGGLLSGVTCGFTFGALVSLIPFGWLPVILGGACISAGIVLLIVFRNNKEAE